MVGFADAAERLNGHVAVAHEQSAGRDEDAAVALSLHVGPQTNGKAVQRGSRGRAGDDGAFCHAPTQRGLTPPEQVHLLGQDDAPLVDARLQQDPAALPAAVEGRLERHARRHSHVVGGEGGGAPGGGGGGGGVLDRPPRRDGGVDRRGRIGNRRCGTSCLSCGGRRGGCRNAAAARQLKGGTCPPARWELGQGRMANQAPEQKDMYSRHLCLRGRGGDPGEGVLKLGR